MIQKYITNRIFLPTDGDDITSYKVMGGGGTQFMCNWEYMKLHDITSRSLLCLLTDTLVTGGGGGGGDDSTRYCFCNP